MTRRQAALLLGVDEDARPAEVRQAWRVWARLAHPDIGGDRGHFDALIQARDVLLAVDKRVHEGEDKSDRPVTRAPARAAQSIPEPHPRYPLRSVCRFPDRRGQAAIACAAFIALVSAATVIVVDEWVAALAMGLGAAAFAIVLERSVGTARTDARMDTGHRISLRVLAWVPMTLACAGLASALGGSVIAVLPALVVPLIAAVAMVNPGAGLWHPVRMSN